MLTEVCSRGVAESTRMSLFHRSPNKALRYGIGVGREGFTWSGSERISRLAEWPDWNPPEQMIERQPYLPRFMAGGEGNPLGARALYLGDTLYRIHSTNQPSTIGTFVSSGCIRLTNEDIMDLYKRVKVGTRVVVLPSGPPMTAAAPVGSRRGMSEVTPYGLPSASDMPRKRYKPEEISAKLQQVDVLVAQGQSIADATRQVGITESRYYRWRQGPGALKRDELKKPKELAHEGPKGLTQGEVSAVRDNAQREVKAESAGFEDERRVATWAGCARAASGHAAAPTMLRFPYAELLHQGAIDLVFIQLECG